MFLAVGASCTQLRHPHSMSPYSRFSPSKEQSASCICSGMPRPFYARTQEQRCPQRTNAPLIDPPPEFRYNPLHEMP